MEQDEVGGSGEARLKILLRGLEPAERRGRFVFTTVEQPPSGVECIAGIVEDEGLTVVLRQDDADRLGLAYGLVAAMITLRIHSALDAVGLTARVTSVLATAGISCNVIAGHFHDHLLHQAHRWVEPASEPVHDEFARSRLNSSTGNGKPQRCSYSPSG